MPIEYLFTPFNLGWPADWSIWGKKGYTTEYRRILWEFLRHCEEKGWTDTNFVMMLNTKRNIASFPRRRTKSGTGTMRKSRARFFDVIGDTYKHSHVKFLFRADESNNYHNHYNSEIGEHIDLWGGQHDHVLMVPGKRGADQKPQEHAVALWLVWRRHDAGSAADGLLLASHARFYDGHNGLLLLLERRWLWQGSVSNAICGWRTGAVLSGHGPARRGRRAAVHPPEGAGATTCNWRI